jgi:NAD(P)-dependent dehydrogenase (short-subunit alcohol dehydrogenase family)
LTDDDFDDMMLVNCKSALYGMQIASKHFKECRAGQIINVSSMLGRIPFSSARSAYCASKHALNSLTCSLRVDLRAQGFDQIHVTLVTPGVVATDFGLNARHGGMDNRQLPGAQPVEEVRELDHVLSLKSSLLIFICPTFFTTYRLLPSLLAPSNSLVLMFTLVRCIVVSWLLTTRPMMWR